MFCYTKKQQKNTSPNIDIFWTSFTNAISKFLKWNRKFKELLEYLLYKAAPLCLDLQICVYCGTLYKQTAFQSPPFSFNSAKGSALEYTKSPLRIKCQLGNSLFDSTNFPPAGGKKLVVKGIETRLNFFRVNFDTRNWKRIFHILKEAFKEKLKQIISQTVIDHRNKPKNKLREEREKNGREETRRIEALENSNFHKFYLKLRRKMKSWWRVKPGKKKRD